LEGKGKKGKGKSEAGDARASRHHPLMKSALSLTSSLLPCRFLLLLSLEVALASVVAAVTVDLDVVLGALTVNAAKLLALLDGARARRVLTRLLFFFVSHRSNSSRLV
jgi:hypothetical protein